MPSCPLPFAPSTKGSRPTEFRSCAHGRRTPSASPVQCHRSLVGLATWWCRYRAGPCHWRPSTRVHRSPSRRSRGLSPYGRQLPVGAATCLNGPKVRAAVGDAVAGLAGMAPAPHRVVLGNGAGCRRPRIDQRSATRTCRRCRSRLLQGCIRIGSHLAHSRRLGFRASVRVIDALVGIFATKSVAFPPVVAAAGVFGFAVFGIGLRCASCFGVAFVWAHLSTPLPPCPPVPAVLSPPPPAPPLPPLPPVDSVWSPQASNSTAQPLILSQCANAGSRRSAFT